MAAARYGQIFHRQDYTTNVRFPDEEARKKFSVKFNEYHESHEHDGDRPTYQNASASEIKDRYGQRLMKYEDYLSEKCTLDGYHAYDIREYHTYLDRSCWYEMPTCCVPPIIEIDNNLIDSLTLQRHELSSVFGDMAEQDFKSLSKSVHEDGITDNIIRLYQGKILDGWHRFKAAREWNLLRKLIFKCWDEEEEGDPKAFVLARNIERRHLSASQRAQIVVTFNERFEHGGERSKSPNGDLKSRKELAEEAKVGTSTIDRAVQVEKAGESEAVISGEKSASEVLLESKPDAAEQDKDEIELRRAHNTAEEARIVLWRAFRNSKLAEHVSEDDFADAACEALGWKAGDYGSPEDYILGKYASLNVDCFTLQERLTWRHRFEEIANCIKEILLSGTPDWVQALLPTEQADPAVEPSEITEEVKRSIRQDIEKARAESDNGNGSGVNGVKYAPIANRHGVPVELVAKIAKEGNGSSVPETTPAEEAKPFPASFKAIVFVTDKDDRPDFYFDRNSKTRRIEFDEYPMSEIPQDILEKLDAIVEPILNSEETDG